MWWCLIFPTLPTTAMQTIRFWCHVLLSPCEGAPIYVDRRVLRNLARPTIDGWKLAKLPCTIVTTRTSQDYLHNDGLPNGKLRAFVLSPESGLIRVVTNTWSWGRWKCLQFCWVDIGRFCGWGKSLQEPTLTSIHLRGPVHLRDVGHATCDANWRKARRRQYDGKLRNYMWGYHKSAKPSTKRQWVSSLLRPCRFSIFCFWGFSLYVL